MAQSTQTKAQSRRFDFTELKIATLDAARSEYPGLQFKEVKEPLPKGILKQSVYEGDSPEIGSVKITVTEDAKKHATVAVDLEDDIIIPGDMRREIPSQILPIGANIRGYLMSNGHLEIDKVDVEEQQDMNDLASRGSQDNPLKRLSGKSSAMLTKAQEIIKKADTNIQKHIQKPLAP